MQNHQIPTEYLAPKWQAYVTPMMAYFKFNNGIAVGSMWELKQALLEIPEDVVLEHVGGGRHDIADWVEQVVGDEELARELRGYEHRWGLLVALERQMMRSLSLPAYVAKRWLATVDHPFVFRSGEKVASLEELKNRLGEVNDEVVAFHGERQPNDIAVWVADIVGDYELADLLAEASSRAQMEQFVSDHLEMLYEAALEC